MTQLDQFYTNKDIASRCYNRLNTLIDINSFDVHLEPSAGNGSFFNIMDETKRVGMDIDPKTECIFKQDFLKYIPQQNKKYLIIGNPPFGKISSLAIKFFNKCAEFAECIAFIVPRTFKRVSVQNKLNMDFELIYNEDLPLTPCCFIPKMTAKCCFQIWIRTNKKRTKIVYDKTHPDFTFVKHGPKDENNQPTPPLKCCDFAIRAYGANIGEIVDKEMDRLRPKSWHWLKSNINVNTLKTKLKQLDYSISKDTVRQDSLGKRELIHLYKTKFG